MITIIGRIIPVNPFSRDGKKLKAKLGIVMHYTGDPGASALDVASYFTSLSNQRLNDALQDRYAGAQYCIDREMIVRTIPDGERAYHCGSPNPYMPDAVKALGSYPNDTTVGIEMCIEKDGTIHEDTFQNAVTLVCWLIADQGFPESIWTHKQVVGWKDCPLPWIKNPAELDRFKKTVHATLHLPIEQNATPDGKEEEFVELVNWQWDMLVKALQELMNAGLFQDNSWIQKAKNKKITVSELLFLNIIMLNNHRKA